MLAYGPPIVGPVRHWEASVQVAKRISCNGGFQVVLGWVSDCGAVLSGNRLPNALKRWLPCGAGLPMVALCYWETQLQIARRLEMVGAWLQMVAPCFWDMQLQIGTW